MRRLLGVLNMEQKGVHASALLLASAAVINAVLGLFRDRLLAGRFGASTELDIYYAAFRIPDFIFAAALLFVASTAFIPIFLERRKQSHESAQRILNASFTVFLVVVGGLVGVAYVLMPTVIPLTVPGFSAAAQGQVIRLASLLLLSPLLLGLSNLVSGVIQSMRRFFVYALSPVFYNLGIIIGILFFVPRFGLIGLGWGVALGALMHLMIQFPSLLMLRYVPFFGSVFDKDIFRMVALSFPRALALSFHQFTFFAITAIASTLGGGAIAVFHLSYNLQSLPLVVVGLSYSVAAFPFLSELSIQQKHEHFFLQCASAARYILFWTIPASVLFITLRAHIVRVVLGAGAFGWVDTRLTAASLLLFSLGIVAQSLVILFVRSYYAMGKTREPVLYNFFSFIFIIASAWLLLSLIDGSTAFRAFFVQLLRVQNLRNVAILALPLAYSLGMALNAALLFTTLWRQHKGNGVKTGVWRTFKEVLGAGVIMGIVILGMLRLVGGLLNLETFVGIFSQGFIAGVVGIAAGALVLWYMKNRELIEIITAFRTRFWKEKPLQPETEHL